MTSKPKPTVRKKAPLRKRRKVVRYDDSAPAKAQGARPRRLLLAALGTLTAALVLATAVFQACASHEHEQPPDCTGLHTRRIGRLRTEVERDRPIRGGTGSAGRVVPLPVTPP